MEEIKKSQKGKDKKLLLFGAIALAGIIILAMGKFNTKKEADATAAIAELDPAEYSENVEKEIAQLCKSIVGDCEVHTVVSLDGGFRSVYASDKQSTSGGYKNSTVLVGSGNSEGAVLVRYENPSISGIGIVLSCKESEKAKNDIISLVSSAYNVGTNKIHVVFGKG